MFMWTDLRCHSVFECGRNADVGRMMDYHERNPLAPAQPCRCLDPQRNAARLPTVENQLLSDNCDACTGHSPVLDRPLAAQAVEEDARCTLVPRGSQIAETYEVHRRSPGDPTPETQDFMCIASDPWCRDTAISSVDAHWIGWNEADAEVQIYTYSYLISPSSQGPVDLFTYCGQFADRWASTHYGRCVCGYNTARGRGHVSYSVWEDPPAGYAVCDACGTGYSEWDGDTPNGGLCLKHVMDCASTYPEYPMAVQSSTDAAQWACVKAGEFCASPGGLSSYVVDSHSSETQQMCVCNENYAQYGKYGTNPDHPELGRTFQCWLCNNAAGYFDLGSGCADYASVRDAVSSWPEYHFIIRHRIAHIRRGYWERLIPHGSGVWPEDDIRALWWAYPDPSGLTVFGESLYWRPTMYSIPTSLVNVAESEVSRWMWELLHFRKTGTDVFRHALFQFWVCGQASDPSVESEGVCTCVEHASHRSMVGLPPSGDPYAAYFKGITRDECFCDDGYAFDRLSRSCRPHADVCGDAAYSNITYACVCLDDALHDEHGRCTICAGERFRTMDACPRIQDWCRASDADMTGMDIEATKESNACTCRSEFRAFGEQLDGVPGCHSCKDSGHVALLHANGTRACVPISTACPAVLFPSRFDSATTLATGACSCLRGWGWNANTTECSVSPEGYLFHEPSDSPVPPSACGPGVDVNASLTQRRCVCDTLAHFLPASTHEANGDACRGCEAEYMLMVPPNSPPDAPLQCLSSADACGSGTDATRTNQEQTCICKPGFLAFADQPSGSCEDCQVGMGFYRPHVHPAECIPPPTDVLQQARVPSADAWTRVLDAVFEDGVLGVQGSAQGACGTTWSESFGWDTRHMILRTSAMAVPLKNTSHSLEEARAECQAFFPCGGFVAFTMATVEATPIYRFVYLTHHPEYRFGNENINPASLVQTSVMTYASTWTIGRINTNACSDVHVDPAWYWSTWQHRLRAAGMPIMYTSDAVAAQWPSSIRAVLAEPQTVTLFHNYFGHQLNLWPNPRCQLGPLPARASTGCRAKTCPTFSACPAAFPVTLGGDDRPDTDGLCFAPGVVHAEPGEDVWNYTTWFQWGFDIHPRPCQQGTCVFDWREGASHTEPLCMCPHSGLQHSSNDACDVGVNVQADEGTGICRFPLSGRNDVEACAELDVTDDQACPQGRFGPNCAFFDVDGHCHPAGSSTAMCSGHGQCRPNSFPTQPRCACDDGYSGKYCDKPSCDQGCGPFGRCVAMTVPGQTDASFHCVCAVADDASETPLAASADLTGTCTVDLCNDNTGGSNRFGRLVLDEEGKTSVSGAPIGRCECIANHDGIVNSGMFCDKTLCVNTCNVPDEHAHSVCVPCSHDGMRDTPFCGGKEMGAQCDCDSTLRGATGEYWRVQPYRYIPSAEPARVGTLTVQQCTPYCLNGGAWDNIAGRCACGESMQWTGERCEREACPNGVYTPTFDECVDCERQFRISFGDDAKRVCELCATGYTGEGCMECEEGFVMTEPPSSLGGTHCISCNEAITEKCFTPGLAAASCPDMFSVACLCASGYLGAACSECDTANGFWKVTTEDISNGRVLGDATPGMCVPAHAWNGCARDRVDSWTLDPNTHRPVCTCTPPFSSTPNNPPGNPGDCSWCDTDHIWSVAADQCVSCSAELGCDATGSIGASCLDPMVHVANMSNGMPNTCTCRMDLGRGGPTCAECNTAGGWVPIPNLETLQCTQCDRDCGPHGELLCSYATSRCACRGGWTGASCSQCSYCGDWGTCLPVQREGDPFCSCNASMGYALATALVGTPQEYMARCTSCVEGFFRVGRRCLPIFGTCGDGVDVDTTIASEACVCKAEYAPIEQQRYHRCDACADGFFRGPEGVCGTCSPACGANAACVWNEDAERFGCACNSNFAERDGSCSVCAEGYGGPFCQACPATCVSSGGFCVWNENATAPLHAHVCQCPSGFTHTLPGNEQSPCRACVPGVEVGDACMPCMTCGPNARCRDSDGECECMQGFEPAFPFAPPDLMRCSLPQEIGDRTKPAHADHTVFSQLDLPTFAAGMLLVGLVAMCASACVLLLLPSKGSTLPHAMPKDSRSKRNDKRATSRRSAMESLFMRQLRQAANGSSERVPLKLKPT